MIKINQLKHTTPISIFSPIVLSGVDNQHFKPYGITKQTNIKSNNKITPVKILINIISKFHFKFIKILFFSNISQVIPLFLCNCFYHKKVST